MSTSVTQSAKTPAVSPSDKPGPYTIKPEEFAKAFGYFFTNADRNDPEYAKKATAIFRDISKIQLLGTDTTKDPMGIRITLKESGQTIILKNDSSGSS